MKVLVLIQHIIIIIIIIIIVVFALNSWTCVRYWISLSPLSVKIEDPSKIFGDVVGGAHLDTLLEFGSCRFQGPRCGKGNQNLLLFTVQGLEKKWPTKSVRMYSYCKNL